MASACSERDKVEDNKKRVLEALKFITVAFAVLEHANDLYIVRAKNMKLLS